MSLSLTSRARVLAGSKHRSGKGIGTFLLTYTKYIITKAALKVVCIQLPLSVVGVVDFALIIEGVNMVWVSRVTDNIRGTIFPVNVLSCEVSAVVSSPSYCP